MNNPNWTESDKKAWTSWFEIPVSDFERGKKFYESIFQMEIQTNDFGSFKMGIFPHREVGCAICYGQWYIPGNQGCIVYLKSNPDLRGVLSHIEEAGGKIIQPKKIISPDHGYMALFTDSEGNTIALHSEG